MRKRYVMLTVAALLLVLAFRYVLPLILPFVLAMVFSGIVKPVVSYLHQKCGWNYKVSVTAVVLFTVLALAAFGIYIGVMAVRQACVCLQQVPVYCQSVCGMMEQACESVDRVFDLQMGQSMRFVESQRDSLFCWVRDDGIPEMLRYACGTMQGMLKFAVGGFTFVLASFLILMDEMGSRVKGIYRVFLKSLRKSGLAYLRAQLIILFLVAVILTLGFGVMGSECALFLGIVVALSDVLPALGSGFVLIPWFVVELLQRDYKSAAVLATMFVGVTFLREILEPKLFGTAANIKPLYVLIAVYAGVELFGVAGILLGPVGLIILRSLAEDYVVG